MREPDLIVVRGTSSHLDGKWYDRGTMTHAFVKGDTPPGTPPRVAKVELAPTGEFEVRDDGAVAEVWRPVE